MNTKENFIKYLFITFCTLSFYSFGTAMMDYFLLYPSRFLIGEDEFISYHKLLEATILPISVYPFLLITVLNFLLLWFSPRQLPRKLVWISLVCLVLDVLSTALFQAPWNFALSEGKNVELMQKITDTNWVRVFLETLQVIIVFKMLSSCYSNDSVSAGIISRA